MTAGQSMSAPSTHSRASDSSIWPRDVPVVSFDDTTLGTPRGAARPALPSTQGSRAPGPNSTSVRTPRSSRVRTAVANCTGWRVWRVQYPTVASSSPAMAPEASDTSGDRGGDNGTPANASANGGSTASMCAQWLAHDTRIRTARTPRSDIDRITDSMASTGPDSTVSRGPL